jgi:tellurium resistance protein TerD
LSFNKGIERVEVKLKWDPSPLGAPPSDLDLIAATYTQDDPSGDPAYVVHVDSRAPDGTIWLDRDSRTGQGLGFDEVMTLELSRLSPSYVRVVVGAAIQQHPVRRDFAAVANTGFRVVEGYTVLTEGDFSPVAAATAATIVEFARGESGAWEFHEMLRGYDADPDSFARTMGRVPS